MHHRGVLFGREAFGRVGVDFAWNVHVVKSGTAGHGVARSAILPRSITGGTEPYDLTNRNDGGAVPPSRLLRGRRNGRFLDPDTCSFEA
jgi:hypothetical protein